MPTFFSGTDSLELHDNATFHNYYVSLIVNYAGSYCAKVAYVAEVATKTSTVETMRYKNVDDSFYTVEIPKEEEKSQKVLVIFDLNVEKQAQEVLVSEDFQDRFREVEEEKRVAAASRVYTGGFTGGSRTIITGFQGQGGHIAGSVPGGTVKEKDEKDLEENRFSQDSMEGWYDTDGEGYPTFDWSSNKDAFSPEPLPGSTGNSVYLKEETKKTSKTDERSPVSGLKLKLDSSTAKDICMNWLNLGVDSDAIMTDKVIVFKNVLEALVWLDHFFLSGTNTIEFMYFQDVMAKKLIEASREYVPELISRRLGALLNTYRTQSTIAEKLLEVIYAHPVYYQQLDEIKSTKTKKNRSTTFY